MSSTADQPDHGPIYAWKTLPVRQLSSTTLMIVFPATRLCRVECRHRIRERKNRPDGRPQLSPRGVALEHAELRAGPARRRRTPLERRPAGPRGGSGDGDQGAARTHHLRRGDPGSHRRSRPKTTSTWPTASAHPRSRSMNASIPRVREQRPLRGSTACRSPALRMPAPVAPRSIRQRPTTTMDQHGLPDRKLSVVEQCLPGCQARDRKRCRDRVVDIGRQRGKISRLDRDILGERTVAEPSR